MFTRNNFPTLGHIVLISGSGVAAVGFGGSTYVNHLDENNASDAFQKHHVKASLMKLRILKIPKHMREGGNQNTSR